MFLSVLPSHLPAVQQHYPRIDRQDMLRMALAPRQQLSGAFAADGLTFNCRRDSGSKHLYRHGGGFAPDAFTSGQLHDGYFFGIEDEHGGLAAAGGTHIAYRSECTSSLTLQEKNLRKTSSIDRVLSKGVAAIGNIYTRPDCRGRGYGTAVTARIVQALQADGYRLIVLNVSEQNLVARSLYEKLGFVTHCLFVEGSAKRNQ